MRKTNGFLLLLTTLIMGLAGCATNSSNTIVSKEIFLDYIDKNEFFHLENFPIGIEGAVEDRVYTAPDFILDYLNTSEGIDYLTAYEPTAEELELFSQIVKDLPSLNYDILQEHLQGFYFINDWKGAGMLDITLNDQGGIEVVMFLNPRVLTTGLSQWLTERESSCFKDKKKFDIRVDMGEEHSALHYILLHESFHAVDLYNGYTPHIFPSITYLTGSKAVNTLFTKNVWLSYNQPVEEYDFPDRKRITFYFMDGGPKITEGRAVKVYKDMELTPFISLYGSKNFAEDFADLMTMYTLTAKMGTPYSIKILRKGKEVYSTEPLAKLADTDRLKQIKTILP